MKLLVMRHGAAGAASTDSYREHYRCLTDGGRETVKAVARWMLENDEIPSFIVCSNYSRACETARILGDILNVTVDELDELTPNMPVAPVVDAFLADDDTKRVMIVGHTDNIDPFLSKRAGTDEDDIHAKGELRKYDFDRDTGEAEELWRLLPSDLGFVDEYDTPLAGTEEAAEMGLNDSKGGGPY